MKASEFKPGVKFKMKDTTAVFQFVRDSDTHSDWDMITHSGGTSMAPNLNHIALRKTGFRVWAYIESIRMQSDLIKFKDLTLIP